MAWLTAAVLLAASVSLALTACSDSDVDTHPDKVLTKRRTIFKQFTRLMEPLGLVANGRKPYNHDEFLGQVQDLERMADKPWQFFAPDGNYPPTRAKPEVWSQPVQFRQAQDAFLASVHALGDAARQGDQDRIRTAVQGVTDACKSCHRYFRNE